MLHEGIRLKPYLCSAGRTTIGVGRNLQDNGISYSEAVFLLENDIHQCKQELLHFEWYSTMPLGVQQALINMCFNLGLTRLLKFERMIKALEDRNFTLAAKECLDSKWAEQVGDRAKDVALMIRNSPGGA